MANLSPCIWTSRWCFSIPPGFRFKEHGLAGIGEEKMRPALLKNRPCVTPDVWDGAGRRGMVLCTCLFLIMSSYVTGRVARDALFLARFQAVQLAYADIASAVLVGIVVVGYVRLGRRISLRTLVVGSELFFATNCVLFWALARYYHPVWLYPAFYIWVGVFGVLAPTQVWTLANYLLTTREAKRIFGLVGS